MCANRVYDELRKPLTPDKQKNKRTKQSINDNVIRQQKIIRLVRNSFRDHHALHIIAQVCVYVYTLMYICIYIHTYIYREKRFIQKYTIVHVHTQVDIACVSCG